ncbi:MAG: hypothetical protein K6B74_07030 [Ruminococcus sp.]|nr:hypothetical protein [Ruminococcus sp.]
MGDNPSSEGFPPQKPTTVQIHGKKRKRPNKNKIGNLEKADKKVQTNSSKSLCGNKRIADFICTKERSDFRATIARMSGFHSGRGYSRAMA